MVTKIINIDNFTDIDANTIEKVLQNAVEELKNGKVVAFPTETVYGLGANALDKNAVEKIFKIKNRPSDNPLIVHISDIESIKNLIDLNDNRLKNIIEKRIEKSLKYWPGPISFILPANQKVVPDITRGNLPTVAIRYPDHKIAQILIKSCGFPIAAPSANISGKPSCTNAKDVFSDFNGKIEYIIDGGESVFGIESTVVDLTSEHPTILRPGFITKEDLIENFEDIQVAENLKIKSAPKSPGMKYTHYKPDAKVIILITKDEFEKYNHIYNFSQIFNSRIRKLEDISKDFTAKNRIIFINLTNELQNIFNLYDFYNSKKYENIIFFDPINPYNLAKNMYSKFREADKLKIGYILIKPFIKESGIEFSIMNRLIKAAEELWIF